MSKNSIVTSKGRDNVINTAIYNAFDRLPFTDRQIPQLLALPQLSELADIVATDAEEHKQIWTTAVRTSRPSSTLLTKAAYGRGAVTDLKFKLDTGAFTSTLDEASTQELEIDRTLARGEKLFPARGVGGQRIVGLMRWIAVYLGGEWQTIPVLVPPSPLLLQQGNAGPDALGRPPQRNLLGRAQVLGNYLFVVDDHQAYVFRDRSSNRRAYASAALRRFRRQP